MVKIIGFERKSGTFNTSPSDSIQYDNHIVYAISDEVDNVQGFAPASFKVKTSQLFDIFGTNNLSDFIGKVVELKYSIKNSSIVLSKVLLVDR